MEAILKQEAQKCCEEKSLADMIVLLHVIYRSNKYSIQLFSELVSVNKIGAMILDELTVEQPDINERKVIKFILFC